MEFIEPVWMGFSSYEQTQVFRNSLLYAEKDYQNLLLLGWKPQQAREVLPNALKTEIIVKANIREWRHIFQLRCASDAHPQMRALMIPLLQELQEKIPVVFSDIKYSIN